MIERVPHPDGRIKAVRLTRKGRRVLDVARPLWANAQDKVLQELGTSAWNDAERRLARYLTSPLISAASGIECANPYERSQ